MTQMIAHLNAGELGKFGDRLLVGHLRREAGELLLDIVLVGLSGQYQGLIQGMKTDRTIAALEIGPLQCHWTV